MVRTLAAFVVAALLAWPAAVDAKPPAGWLKYTVKKGDTLSRIAKRNKTSVKDLRRINRLKTSRLRIGQVLKVKRGTRRQLRRQAAAERRQTTRKRTRARRNIGPWVTYKVKRGDYLWRIADRFDVTIADLVRANKMGKRRRLMPGQTLLVKRKGSHMLKGGVVLPRGSKEKGYVRMRPKRSWGTPGTIRLLQEVYADFTRLHPTSVPGMVADLSREGGGHLRPHKSHQRGTDIDLSYYKVNNEPMRGLEVVTPESMDVVKTWDLIRLFLNTGHVSAIFMDYKLQGALHAHLVALGYKEKLLRRIIQYPRKGQRKGILRDSPGHHHHLHVRFDCLKASDKCARPRVVMVPEPPNNLLAAVDQVVAEPLVAPAPKVVAPEPVVVDAPPPPTQPPPPRRRPSRRPLQSRSPRAPPSVRRCGLRPVR